MLLDRAAMIDRHRSAKPRDMKVSRKCQAPPIGIDRVLRSIASFSRMLRVGFMSLAIQIRYRRLSSLFIKKKKNTAVEESALSYEASDIVTREEDASGKGREILELTIIRLHRKKY